MKLTWSTLPRMVRFTLLAAVIYGAGKLIALAAPASIFGILRDIGGLGLIVAGGYYGFLALRWSKRKLFWKVRNKLIISFAFVGLIPVALLVLISWSVIVLIFKQVSAFYLENELNSISDSLEESNRQILISYYRDGSESRLSLPLLLQDAEAGLNLIRTRFPSVSLRVYEPFPPDSNGTTRFRLIARRPEAPAGDLSENGELPAWLSDGFDGLVVAQGRLRFENMVQVRGAQTYYLSLRVPFDEELVRQIERRTSIDLMMTSSNPAANASEFQRAYSTFFAGRDFFSVGWVHFFTPVDWSSGESPPQGTQAILLSVPLAILIKNFFAQTSGAGAGILFTVLIALVVAFLVVEVISLLIGSMIGRSITQSIHHIYIGSQEIQAGNFGYTIPSGNRDQLDAMANSFNKMSTSVLRLMSEVSAKEWLEREIQIAKDVQIQLFPQQLPEMRRLQIAALCLPARSVSGDYYDFLPHDAEHLDLVVGDISGKGISAALLMASLQSSIRNQLLFSSARSNGHLRIATAVSEINRMLYRQTPAEKYSTVVIGHFDAANLTLTYCNAGHNPPLHFSNGRVRRLGVGGTVIGLFEQRDYDEETVRLEPEDILLFYTDGVVEASNRQEVEFGEERLMELISSNRFLTADDLQQLVVQELTGWTAGQEPADDITLVVVKVLRS